MAITTVFLAAQFTFAKSPDQLKTELAGILPAGKKLHLAWSQGGANSSIYVVDSDDGVVRELTPASLFSGGKRNITVPFITRDGRRVAFVEELSYFVYIIDWDGTNLRKLFNDGCIGAAWQNPDSLTQWLLMDIDGSSLVNLDNTALRVTVWSGGLCVGDNDGVGISLD
jgi:Tol biopolymer transport system component